MNIFSGGLSQLLPGRRFFFPGLVTLATWLIMTPLALAADQTYSGDFLNRSTLTGDWGGVRNDLAKKGVTFDMNVTQTEQGVVGGGKSSSWEYGGRGDLMLKIDTGKLGLWPGGFLTAEVEGNWGHGVNGNTGALFPVNTNQIFPVPEQDGVAMPALNFAQFLSEYFGVVAGKLDTVTSGDMNEFAHGTYGKGDTQFMNLSLNFNPVLLMTVPYSTLGAGMIILPTKDPKAAIVTTWRSQLRREGQHHRLRHAEREQTDRYVARPGCGPTSSGSPGTSWSATSIPTRNSPHWTSAWSQCRHRKI